MIGYVTLGTSDLERSGMFYDAMAAALGTSRKMEWPGGIAWGDPQGPGLGVTRPANGEAPSPGNGCMVGFRANSKAHVEALHALALANGGSCEGPPGYRGDTFYVAYFRDPDGNKLNAHFWDLSARPD